jgi:hypothetical protein
LLGVIFEIIQPERGLANTSPWIILDFPCFAIQEWFSTSHFGLFVADIPSKIRFHSIIGVFDIEFAKEKGHSPLRILDMEETESRLTVVFRVLIDASQGVNVEYLLRYNLADVGSATIYNE